MALSRALLGACSAAPILLLTGCGGGETSTTSTSTSKPRPDAACYADNGGKLPADHCCCMSCSGDTDDSVFGAMPVQNCTQQGGQCKSSTRSSYQRPAPALHAGELCDANGHNDFQRHLIGGTPDYVQVVFVGNTSTGVVKLRQGNGTEVVEYTGSSHSYTFLRNPNGFNGFEKADRGQDYADCQGEYGAMYKNATCYYTSDVIHRVDLTNLKSGTRYTYQLDGHTEWVDFMTPPALGEPITLAFTADLGQTQDSNLTMTHMRQAWDEGKYHAVVFPGDLSYADGAPLYWDAYGRLGDFLWKSVPTAYGVGNHEVASGYENFENFLPRYSWPLSEDSNSTSPLWYSFNTGNVHVIMLCSYCESDKDSEQFSWLSSDLEAVNRTQSPWVVVNFHTPFYTSSTHHTMDESKVMRESMEDLMFKHVDFVVAGHVHAYERTFNVYKGEKDECGPVHITIGDGGNQEGPACGMASYDWSAKTEYSFGFGTLEVMNETHATWHWYRNQQDLAVADNVTIVRPTSKCNVPATMTV